MCEYEIFYQHKNPPLDELASAVYNATSKSFGFGLFLEVSILRFVVLFTNQMKKTKAIKDEYELLIKHL